MQTEDAKPGGTIRKVLPCVENPDSKFPYISHNDNNSFPDLSILFLAVAFAASLLHVEPKILEESLLIRTNIVGKEVFKVPLTLEEVI